jgi:hypothetical protein
MTHRSATTIETLGFRVTFPAGAGSATIGRETLLGRINTKWMTKPACDDYLAALRKGMPQVHKELEQDPHTRRAVLHGPVGACWVATQVISTATPGEYEAHVMYRSMDEEHLKHDLHLQTAIAHAMLEPVGARLTRVVFSITSYHSYL